MLMAALVLAERPSPIQLTGALLVCGGVLVASRAASPAAPGAQEFYVKQLGFETQRKVSDGDPG